MQRQLIFLLLLLSLAHTAISGISATGSLDPAGTTTLHIMANFSDSEGKLVYLNISGPLDSVTVKDRSGLVLQSKIVVIGNDTLIYATVPTDFLEFDITSESFTMKNGDQWSFDYIMGSSENISSFSATISFPPGSALTSTDGSVQANSNSISITWLANSIDTSHRIHLRAGYDLQIGPTPQNLTTIGIVAAFIIVVISFLVHKYTTKPAPIAEEKEAKAEGPKVVQQNDSLESNSVFKTLDETDKEIIREMANQGGKTTQAHLYMNTHIPKATLSRRLASLMNKGIIQKSQKGNRNLVSLTDLIKKD